MASHKNSPVLTVRDALKRRAKIPDSWRKAFGILRGKKPDPIKEFRRMRKRDEIRSKALEKLWKR